MEHYYSFLFGSIMMLSVLKNTKTPVKFWFLKNYLSPTFKVCFTEKKKLLKEMFTVFFFYPLWFLSIHFPFVKIPLVMYFCVAFSSDCSVRGKQFITLNTKLWPL